MAAAGGVGRWTRYFTVASALSMVALQTALLCDESRRTTALVGLFGAVLPMVFGMAYLLLPSYVGRTLSVRWLPGVHFVVAYAGVGLLVADGLFGLDAPFVALGATLWSLGVAVFVGTLLRTIGPAVIADPERVLRSGDRPQRSTRLATVTIPISIGYLVVGTVALLSTFTALPNLVGTSLRSAIHYYGAGFAVLLVFSLGVRLLTGFFHVSPPRYLSWTVLLCGAVAPGLVGANFWRPPWFYAGGGLEAIAVVGYLGLVGVIARETDRERIGLYGIVFGAVSGTVGVGAAAFVALGVRTPRLVAVHVPVVLVGFLVVTIVGYAYQFFPVTNAAFAGTNERTALVTIVLLAAGTAIQALGGFAVRPRVRAVGAVVALLGAAGYAYLMSRRLLRQ